MLKRTIQVRGTRRLGIVNEVSNFTSSSKLRKLPKLASTWRNYWFLNDSGNNFFVVRKNYGWTFLKIFSSYFLLVIYWSKINHLNDSFFKLRLYWGVWNRRRSCMEGTWMNTIFLPINWQGRLKPRIWNCIEGSLSNEARKCEETPF